MGIDVSRSLNVRHTRTLLKEVTHFIDESKSKKDLKTRIFKTGSDKTYCDSRSDLHLLRFHLTDFFFAVASTLASLVLGPPCQIH